MKKKLKIKMRSFTLKQIVDYFGWDQKGKN